MFIIKPLKIVLLAIWVSILFASCFKDVDFGQSENISLDPDLEVDLLFYQLNETDFTDSETNEFTAFIRDTVRLEFLDDSYIQDGLMHAEFRFLHKNKFPYKIQSNIRFLSENGSDQFNVAYSIPEGSPDSQSIVDTTYIVPSSEISKVRNSIQMVLELELLEVTKDIQGTLDFQAKGLFKFEF